MLRRLLMGVIPPSKKLRGKMHFAIPIWRCVVISFFIVLFYE